MFSTDREKVEFYVSCRKLKNLDILSKSDPLVRCYVRENSGWKLIGQTEMQKDNLNPNFQKTFIVDFVFEIQQPIRFEVLDIDSNNSHDDLGSVETTVGALMGAKKQTTILDLHIKGNKTSGKIIIRGEKTGDCKNTIFWQWNGIKLMNTDGLFGKSDPFLRFFKVREGGDLLQVHETEVIKDNLNPIWKPFQIFETKLCSNHSQVFRVECWDREKSGKHQYIGDCQLSIDMIKSGRTEYELTNPKKKGKTGTLRVSNFSLQERPSFIDYLRGGVQLNALIAIDFTGSNGIQTRPDSLHAMLPGGNMNEYQKAISSVCQIILNYDYDQQVPVYGFGGKPCFPTMRMNTVSHCFPCSGVLQQQEVLGLQGIMDVYNYALQHVELSGPTYFAPLINEALKACQAHKQAEDDVYSILLIITDGEIHDMDQTIDAIAQAAYLPLSIVIVGVGNADFSKMEVLDGDAGLCTSRGERIARDLVQFVPFREFKGDMYLLAQRLLAEVPDQLVGYYGMINKKPRPAQVVDITQLGLSKLPTMQPTPQQAGGIPQQAGGYPGQQNAGGYPGQAGGYPGQQNGGNYPGQTGGYPSQQNAGGYPGQAGGYPGQQNAGGYPGQAGGYGQPNTNMNQAPDLAQYLSASQKVNPQTNLQSFGGNSQNYGGQNKYGGY